LWTNDLIIDDTVTYVVTNVKDYILRRIAPLTFPVSGRTIFPAGLLQVVFVITIVNPHLTMINFKDAISAAAHKKH
jgi:hypothetical protein